MTELAAATPAAEHDPLAEVWARLTLDDWSSSAAAYETASDARTIISETPMTITAFAGECSRRKITGFGSQGAVSRRLRWADLHDQLWADHVLPAMVFISETASRPLFDGKLNDVDRLRLLSELFGPHLSDRQRAELADELTAALMREHLRAAGHKPGRQREPRRGRARLDPDATIGELLSQGTSVETIVSALMSRGISTGQLFTAAMRHTGRARR